MKEGTFATANGALVMALGILLVGAAQNIESLRGQASTGLAVILLMILLVLIAGYLSDAIRGTFYNSHIKHAVKSFGTGTWVAGLSIAALVVFKKMPAWEPVAVGLYSAALLLWACYMAIAVRNYRHILHSQKLAGQVEGVLLLPTVGTQSIVITGSNLFGSSFPETIESFLISVGLAFYLAGMALILTRYYRDKRDNLADDWKNTNCIMHGALSISGLACASLTAVPTNYPASIWIAALALFMVIELMEIARAWQRIRKYGWKKGIFAYSTTQWSRNFTYGMMVAFSAKLSLGDTFLAGSRFFASIQHVVLREGSFLVIGLFILEALLLMSRPLFAAQAVKLENCK